MPDTTVSWEPSIEASVLVEVGGSRGALILYAPTSLLGAEIEVQSVGGPPLRTHTAVRERLLPDGSVAAALFGSLPEGPYQLGGRDEIVHVAAGTVSEYHLR